MTMPYERTRALVFAGELLKDLLVPSKTPGVPDEIRDRARHVLRHYPSLDAISVIADHDARGAFVMPMLDVSGARNDEEE